MKNSTSNETDSVVVTTEKPFDWGSHAKVDNAVGDSQGKDIRLRKLRQVRVTTRDIEVQDLSWTQVSPL